jgi:hypothetical protein
MRTARTATALAAAIIMLGAPAAATAAYAPGLDVKLDPAAPASAAAITSTVTQTSSETASKTVKVSFPTGFETNPNQTVTPCTDAQEAAESCPEASRIGTANADAALVPPVPATVHLLGNVYVNIGANIRILVYLKDPNGLIPPQKVVGQLQLRPDGGFDAVFDNLPNTLTTSFQLKLEGGGKSALLTPRVCGPLTFEGTFTSQNGETAKSTSTVQMTDCPETPVISKAKVKPTKFRSVRRSSDRARAGYGTVLSWTSSQATSGTRITVERSVKPKKKGRKPKWKRVGTITGPGASGPNTLVFDGRVKDKRLSAGKYRFGLTTRNAKGLTSSLRRVSFKIVK